MRTVLIWISLILAVQFGHTQITVDPNSGMANSAFKVMITGVNTNFMQGTTTCVEFTMGNTTYNLTDVEVGSGSSLMGMLTTPANAPAGDYDVKVYLGPGCDSTEWDCEDCFSIVDCNLSAAGQGTDVSCNGADDGTATANVQGGVAPVTINWSNGMTGSTISDLAPATYTFTVEDGLGCMVDGSVTIAEPAELVAAVAGTMDVSCFGAQDGSIDLDVMGGTGDRSFMWDNGAGNIEDPGDLGAGTYNVVVMDDNGCVANASANVSSPDSITLMVTSTDLSGVMSDDGTATANAMGGTADYSYLWNTGAITATISDLAAGTYSVTVTDANGCEATGSAVVSGVDCSITLASEVTDLLCPGDSTGSINYLIEGASDQISLTVSGSPEIIGTMAVNLTAGVYEAVVFDSSNSCSAIILDTVLQPDAIDIVIDTVIGDTGDSNGVINSTVSGGTGMLTFEWSTNGNVVGLSEDLDGLAAGAYVLKVSDGNGCMAFSDTIVIEMTTSLLEEAFASNIRFYPNPTDGKLNIFTSDSQLDIGEEIEIYSADGKFLRQIAFKHNVVDLTNLSMGIYWAKININRRAYLSKVVKL